jgi:hypothetical protein
MDDPDKPASNAVPSAPDDLLSRGQLKAPVAKAPVAKGPVAKGPESDAKLPVIAAQLRLHAGRAVTLPYVVLQTGEVAMIAAKPGAQVVSQAVPVRPPQPRD